MARAHNFNAGPAGLPLPALERAQRELLDFEGTGMSIMEHSHRGKAYEAVHDEAVALTRELLGVPEGYYVLFLQGGASLQFAQVPMNFLPAGKSADYLITGGWSEKAYQEAQRLGTVRLAATTEHDKRYTRIPRQAELKLDPEAAYVHLTSNNTLFGTQWHHFPDVGSVPLIGDMSSDFMWRRFDVSKFSLIYAGAQKNIGPSGVVMVLGKSGVPGRRQEGHPHHPALRHARLQQLALQHAPDLRHLPGLRNAVLACMKEAGRARGHRGAEPEEGRPALRRDRRRPRFLPGPGGEGQPLVHERGVPAADRGAREEVRRRGDEGAHGGPRRAPVVGRDPRVALQRRLGGVGRSPRRLHEVLRQEGRSRWGLRVSDRAPNPRASCGGLESLAAGCGRPPLPVLPGEGELGVPVSGRSGLRRLCGRFRPCARGRR